jgi:hypothetical protein
MSSSGGAMFVQPDDPGPSMGGVPASTGGERCFLAASEVVCRRDNGKVRKLFFLSIVTA